MSLSSSAQRWKYNFILWIHGSELYVGMGEEIEHISAVLKAFQMQFCSPAFLLYSIYSLFINTLFPSKRGGWLWHMHVSVVKFLQTLIDLPNIQNQSKFKGINVTNRFDFYCFKNFNIPPAKHFGFWLVLSARWGLGPRNNVLTTCKAVTFCGGLRIIGAFSVGTWCMQIYCTDFTYISYTFHFFPWYLVTLLPFYPGTLWLCYLVNLSVTLLPCNLLLCYPVTLLPCYSVTLLLCYLINLSVLVTLYLVTLLPSQNMTTQFSMGDGFF